MAPGGNRIDGDYTRHSFTYTVPEDEPGEGGTVAMRQLNDQTIEVLPEGATKTQLRRRCSAPTA